ncbi:hypothetical protein JG687_00005375 [Phytophthora cactorum]|uniref:Uncharacterized protein n=1 Tax=Phytophthora cactorum TaxID=29920 RepID=A0A8T1UND3_9STRA|nr:hypothetical protein JG687_00005375 [Phytophthora cactorum]
MPRSTPVFTNNMITHRGLRSARPLQTHRVTNKPKYDWSIFADTFVKLEQFNGSRLTPSSVIDSISAGFTLSRLESTKK